MERCTISGKSMIGLACQNKLGESPEVTLDYCFLMQAIRLEPKKELANILHIVQRQQGCPFQEQVLNYINQNTTGNP